MAGVALAGCAERAPSLYPAEAVALLRTGQPLLSCREACVAEWRGVQPQAAQLDAAARWPELAALVLRVRYQDDLSLYYLGRAADGLGYPGAAASYYRQSTYISGTSLSCEHMSRVCGGLALPRAAMVRIAAIERAINQPRPRRAGPAPPRAATPDPDPAAAEAAPPPIEPAPPPVVPTFAPLPAEPAAPVPPATGPAAFEFIEPPAAR